MTKRKPTPPRKSKARPNGDADGKRRGRKGARPHGREGGGGTAAIRSAAPGTAPTQRPPATAGLRSGRGAPAKSKGLWLYGSHAVLAALANPGRPCRRLLLSREAARHHGGVLPALLEQRKPALTAESAERHELEALLPEGAVHQGLALQVEALPARVLEDLIEAEGGGARPVIVALDQVTDPRNVGAILRSAAAFGARGVIAPARHTAPPGGALAKAASGALEALPYIEVSNLARALDRLKAAGFWCLGLAGEAPSTLAEADGGGPLVLVLGAEGKGLRRLTRETCDALVRLPTQGPVASLNVSNAAAVALYQVLQR